MVFIITQRQPVLFILCYIIYYTFNWSFYIVVGQVGLYSVATKPIYVRVQQSIHTHTYINVYTKIHNLFYIFYFIMYQQST